MQRSVHHPHPCREAKQDTPRPAFNRHSDASAPLRQPASSARLPWRLASRRCRRCWGSSRRSRCCRQGWSPVGCCRRCPRALRWQPQQLLQWPLCLQGPARWPPRPLAAACPKAAGQKGEGAGGIRHTDQPALERPETLKPCSLHAGPHPSSTPGLSARLHRHLPVCCTQCGAALSRR